MRSASEILKFNFSPITFQQSANKVITATTIHQIGNRILQLKDITEKVFWYRAKETPNFTIGSKKYKKYHLYPNEIIVMGGRSLLNEFKNLTIFDYPLNKHTKKSIAISYIENPLATVLFDDGFDGGTFSLEILLNHPISVWIPPTFGIAYPGVVAQDHYSSRWVLQINDGFEHDVAEEIIPLL